LKQLQAILLVVTICACHAQPNAVMWQIPLTVESEIARDPSAAQGSIEGVVVDARNGDVLRGAQIFLAGSRDGAISDSLGHFWFVAQSRSKAKLRAQYIGYSSTEFAVDSRQSGGLVARIALAPGPVSFCADLVEPMPLLTVAVSDARTGRIPKTAVSLIARDGGRTFVDSVPRDTNGVALLEIDHLPAGSYEISVAADGYRRWRKSNVHFDFTCNPWKYYRAWLIPGGR
jgi:hypothetical protein